jgi:E3 ubiquitin-protein ligase synoviolin
LYDAFFKFQTIILAYCDYVVAIHTIQEVLPAATAEDLARSDSLCIVCREEMTPDQTPRKLECGHIFHSQCLMLWMQRQPSCPTCRARIIQEMVYEFQDDDVTLNPNPNP